MSTTRPTTFNRALNLNSTARHPGAGISLTPAAIPPTLQPQLHLGQRVSHTTHSEQHELKQL
eukprot:11557499-Alexandrium_andersonii.AAC.1